MMYGWSDMMGWGWDGFGMFGWLCAFVWLIVTVDLVLLGLWLWKQIKK